METEIAKIYDLECASLEMEREEAFLKEAIAQGKYDLRMTQVAVMEYEGSLRSFLDRLRGTKENHLEQLQRSLRNAREELTRHQCVLESLYQKRIQIQTERKKYPLLADIPNCPEKHKREAQLCLSVLDPMLEALQAAMLDCRDLEQGRHVGELLSIEERQMILSKPVTMGTDCGLWLRRLETALTGLKISCSIPEFYRNPSVYLAATQYTRRDRLNAAIDQTVQLRRQFAQLKKAVKDQ